MLRSFDPPMNIKLALTYDRRRSFFTMISNVTPARMHPKEMKAHLAHTKALCERSSELLLTFEELLYDEAKRRIVPLWVVWPMYSLTYAFHCALYGRMMDLDRRLGEGVLNRIEYVRVRYCHRIRYFALSELLGLHIPIYNLGR